MNLVSTNLCVDFFSDRSLSSALKYFLLQNLQRFEGLKLQQPDIEISSATLKDKDVPELIKIFDCCVDAKSPSYHPLVQVDGYDTKDYLTLLIIEECHVSNNSEYNCPNIITRLFLLTPMNVLPTTMHIKCLETLHILQEASTRRFLLQW